MYTVTCINLVAVKLASSVKGCKVRIKNKLTFHRPLPRLDKLAPFQHHQSSAGIFPSIQYDTVGQKSVMLSEFSDYYADAKQSAL